MVEVKEHEFSENAIQMMEGRYLLDGETPKEMFGRVAGGLAEVEAKYYIDGDKDKLVEGYRQEFYDVMISGKFVPAGRTLTNTGISSPVVPNCIVLPIEDSMDSIFHTLHQASLLQQAGSGIGFNFSNLRPAMYDTKRSRGKASGPVSFLQTYNDCFARIQQQGRHGANMAMIHISHPDMLDFINCKKIEGNIANFNISVLIDDEFMKTLENHPHNIWMCVWNGEMVRPRRIVRDEVGIIQNIEEIEISVEDVFNEIVNASWHNGEPGVAFIDEINRTNPLPGLGDIDCSNPCGEQYLHAYDNCNLGSINLAKFVMEDQTIDYEELTRVTAIAIRMLDNVIDTFDIPIQEVQDMALANRRIGLGPMGFADMLYQLDIPYDSESALQIAEHVMETINQSAIVTSIKIGKEKRIFPNKDKSRDKQIARQRNAALTTVAPTGSISMLYDTSSGIEPNFALSYTKKVRTGDYKYVNEYFEKALNELNLTDDLKKNILGYVKEMGTLNGIASVYAGYLPFPFLATFRTSNDISIDSHINMQAKFQEHVDNSISKTINMPEETTEEEIRKAFIRGWQMKCKSFTVYRNNSRKVQVLNMGEEVANGIKKLSDKSITEETIEAIHDVLEANKIDREKGKGRFAGIDIHTDNPEEFLHEKIFPKDSNVFTKVVSNARGYDVTKAKVIRPKVVEGKNYKVKTAHGNMYVGIQRWDGKIYEVFTNIGKSGGCVEAYTSGITRMITLALRHGVPLNEIVEQLKDISCHSIWDDGVQIASPVDGIAFALAHEIPEKDQDDYTKRLLDREKVRQGGVAIYHASAEQMTPKEGSVFVSPSPYEMQEIISEVCQVCSSTDMVRQEGCVRCLTCGDSRC